MGGEELYEHASRALGLGNKQVSPDGLISLEEVECMGACSWAPAIQINYDFHHRVTPERFDQLMAALRDGTYERRLLRIRMRYNEPSPLEVKVISQRFDLPNPASIDTYLGQRRLRRASRSA